jgi:Fibronectin type III domain
MEDSEIGAGFAPRIRNPALLRLSAAVLLVSLAGCPGAQISQNSESAPAGSVPSGQSPSTPAPAPTSVTVPAKATGTATLSWQAPTENEDGTPIEGLAGYYIHFGPSAAELNQLIEVNDPALTTYAVNGLTAGTYYFAVGAYNAFGIEGLLSNIATKSF